MRSASQSPPRRTRAAAFALFLAIGCIPGRASGQGTVIGQAVIIQEPDDRAGPRFGVAALTRGSETAAKEGKKFSPVTTLFGWQFEHGFRLDSGLTLVSEWVLLVGGLEQNVPLPSATWLIGFRVPNGIEGGVGPTLTGSGTQIAVAAGITHKYGPVNIPVNVAFAPARVGVSLSITAGFNLQR